MRLTLRTLLAYLDDVLDPVDKEELAQKIESSEFAEDLVHRTRDTVRRLRLSAPQVVGTGMGLDPNTVAEYLDNVMPPEQVGDFERICLESDVHLAEATACHHVLTMVLGEPADVDPASRQRMYAIATEATERKRLRVEPAHTTPATAAAAAAAPMTVAAAVASQPRGVEIPDYLRAGAWWRSTGVLMGLAAVLLVGVGIVLFSGLQGWFGGTKPLEPLTAAAPTTAAETIATSAMPAAEQPAAPAADVSTTAATPSSQPSTTLASPPPPMTPGIAPPAAAVVASETPDRYAVNGATTPPQPAENDIAASTPPTPVESAPINPPLPAATGTPPANETASIPSAPPLVPTDPSATPVAPTESAASAPATGDLAAATPPAGATPVVPPSDPTAIPPLAGPDAKNPNRPRDLGTYMGNKTVLLRHDDKTGAWFRMEPRAAVMPGQRLLSLPEFRPKIALVSGVHVDLSGGTQVVLGGDGGANAAGPPADTDGVPSIELVYGRMILINPTNAESKVRLKLGPASGEARLARNSSLAVEVERKYIPGADPRQAPSPVEVRLFAPEGGIVWHGVAGDKTIDKPSRWTVTVAGAADIADDKAPPEWIDHEPAVQLSEQRYGAPVIESTLVSNVPVDTQLLELFQGSGRKEVKSLVARSSIHVGLFPPFIDALRDSEQKANWKTHIETLRAAMALSPESANKVWQALVDQRGRPAAADLYKMLCGYNPEQVGHTPDQMKTGALLELIGYLENDSLDYRVLAVHDLREITGKALMANPAASLAERTQNIRRWRARLEAGELKPVSEP